MADRMSPVGSIMWGVGQDATLRMIVGNVIVLDRAPTRAALAERLDNAAQHVGRLRQRPDGPGRLRTRPAWVDVAAFEAGNHVRTTAVASPGHQRQVLDLVALLEPSPFDPFMSPWDVTVIEGLEGGRAALYLRAHHSLMDGSHGVSLVRSMLDEAVAGTATADEQQPPQPADTTEAAAVTDDIDSSSVVSSRRRPGTVSVTDVPST